MLSVRQYSTLYKESEVLEIYLCIASLLCSAPKTLFILSLNLLLFSILKIDSDFFLFAIASFVSFFSFICFYYHDKDKWINFVYKTLNLKKTKTNLNFAVTPFRSLRYLYLVPFLYPCFFALGFIGLSFSVTFYLVCLCFEYIYVSSVYGRKTERIKQIGGWFLPAKILSSYKTKRRRLNKVKKEKYKTYEEIKNSAHIINHLKNTKNLSSSEIHMKIKIIEDIKAIHSDEILELHLNKRHEIINN